MRERRAALLDLSGAQVDPRGARDRAEVDAVMRVELAILDHLERRRQERRDLVRRHDDAIFAVDREDAADQQRIEAEDRHVLAAAVAHALDRVAARDDRQQLRLLQRVPELEAAIDEIDARAAAAVAARLLGLRRRVDSRDA